MAERNFHPCAATGCQRRVPQHLLMCIDHWRMVPAPLAREVLAAWQALRVAGVALRTQDAMQAVVLAQAAHADAVARAVAAVAAKQVARAQKEHNLFD